MKRPTPVLAAAVLAAAVSLPAQAPAKSIELPADGVTLKPSSLPGYAKAQVNCVVCHSAEYMAYQPANASRAYWTAMVKRMKEVFKGPINEADMPDIIDYLSKTYGNEQPQKQDGGR